MLRLAPLIYFKGRCVNASVALDFIHLLCVSLGSNSAFRPVRTLWSSFAAFWSNCWFYSNKNKTIGHYPDTYEIVFHHNCKIQHRIHKTKKLICLWNKERFIKDYSIWLYTLHVWLKVCLVGSKNGFIVCFFFLNHLTCISFCSPEVESQSVSFFHSITWQFGE